MSMALDEKRGIVYAPTGSAVTDSYRYDRIGNDSYAKSLLALDANTGKRIWHFQRRITISGTAISISPAVLTVKCGSEMVDARVMPPKCL
jgi:quinoprotein glucose dehydrogenase